MIIRKFVTKEEAFYYCANLSVVSINKSENSIPSSALWGIGSAIINWWE